MFASGEVYHLNTRAPWSLTEVGNFDTNLGQILRSYDGDRDGMDEIFAAKAKTVISDFFSLLLKTVQILKCNRKVKVKFQHCFV